MTLKKDDLVVIRCGHRVLDGVVLLASANEESLMISFDALLGGHVGMMPVSRQDDGRYRSIVDGTMVSIEAKRRARARS